MSTWLLVTDGYILYRMLEIILLAVVLIGLIAAARSWHRWSPARRYLAALLVSIPVVAVAQMLWNSFQIDNQPQGRYLFVAAPALAVMAAFALYRATVALPGAARFALLVLGVGAGLIFDAAGLYAVQNLLVTT
jgi:hypothetical protein